MNKYKIRYRELAEKDLNGIYSYIVDTLKSPQAAGTLLDDIERAVERIAMFPFSCMIFHHDPPLPEEFRMLSVKNYAVFYVVKEDIVEIRRIIYAKMDLEKIIK